MPGELSLGCLCERLFQMPHHHGFGLGWSCLHHSMLLFALCPYLPLHLTLVHVGGPPITIEETLQPDSLGPRFVMSLTHSV